MASMRRLQAFLRALPPAFVLVFALACALPLSAFAQEEKASAESFTIHLENYFVELQGGQRVDLEIHYQYASNIARADIPDYRAVQILVEDALYGMPNAAPYWEITNKEIVFRLLTAFPQFPKVTSQFSIQPRSLLNIRRGSTVAFSQSDLPGYNLLTQLDQDSYYQARDGHYNILIPRPLKASLADLIARVRNSAENAADPHGVILDLAPFPLAGSEHTFPALLASLKPTGPYDALVLPEKIGLQPEHHLTKIASLGPLRGIVQILCNAADKSRKPVAEISLAALLGLDPQTIAHLPLADAREKFFLGQAPFIVMEEKYAKPYQLRGDPIEPFAPETQLALFTNNAPAAPKNRPVPSILSQ